MSATLEQYKSNPEVIGIFGDLPKVRAEKTWDDPPVMTELLRAPTLDDLEELIALKDWEHGTGAVLRIAKREEHDNYEYAFVWGVKYKVTLPEGTEAVMEQLLCVLGSSVEDLLRYMTHGRNNESLEHGVLQFFSEDIMLGDLQEVA